MYGLCITRSSSLLGTFLVPAHSLAFCFGGAVPPAGSSCLVDTVSELPSSSLYLGIVSTRYLSGQEET